LFYAQLLIWFSDPLVKILDTGVRVLPQREWHERECRIYGSLRRPPVRIDADGVIALPKLGGETLAALLDILDEESARKRAIELGVVSLVELHRLGITHGDAMAENVLIDLDAGVAHWFDFETVHDASRPMIWRRADDLRALLATCLLRTARESVAETLQRILDVYGDEQVTRLVASSFKSVFRRPLAFHLAQAGLSFESFSEIARLLRARAGE
jgi:tRNA A-37 threonylcarbamoyl transferase component Bud32